MIYIVEIAVMVCINLYTNYNVADPEAATFALPMQRSRAVEGKTVAF